MTGDEALGALLEGKSIPAKSVLLTFDDFYSSWVDPIGTNPSIVATLQDYGFNALLFVTVGKMKNSSNWNALKKLNRTQFGIGCHNIEHYPDATASLDEVIRQVADSKNQIEKQLGITVRSYAYPYGSRNDTTRLHLRKNGYKIGFNFGYGGGKEDAAWDNYSHGVRESLLEKSNITRIPMTQINKYSFNDIFGA